MYWETLKVCEVAFSRYLGYQKKIENALAGNSDFEISRGKIERVSNDVQFWLDYQIVHLMQKQKLKFYQ